MARATIGKWGKNLAVRFPLGIAKAAYLNEGDNVEIETRGNDIVIHRSEPGDAADARAAAAAILAEKDRHDLGDVTVRELLEEGRRG